MEYITRSLSSAVTLPPVPIHRCTFTSTMSVDLDEHFPDLESVAKFLKSDEGNIENIRASTNTRNARSQDEAINSENRFVQEQITKIQEFLDTGRIDKNQLTDNINTEIEVIEQLKEEKALLEWAIKVDHQLSTDPAKHASDLRQTLLSLEKQNSTRVSELASEIVNSIHIRWFDKEMGSRLSKLRDMLKREEWPKKDPSSTEFFVALEQCLEIDTWDSIKTFSVITEAIAERILFNFSGKKDTAHPGKPEWLFSYYFRILEPHYQWFSTDLRRFVDAPMDKILTALVPTLIKTCRQTYPIDSHFVTELIQFCNDISSKFYNSAETIDGLLYGIFDETTLRNYIAAESSVYSRSLDILLRSGSQKIDFDADVPCAKPTFVALNVSQMIQEAEYLHRLDTPLVLNSIQLNAVQKYIELLEQNMAFYEKAHSSLARAIITNRDSVPQEVPELETLARIYGSASFFKGFLEMWSNELVIASISNNIDIYIESLKTLKKKAASRITSFMIRDSQKQLKAYFRIDWNLYSQDDKMHGGSPLIRTAIEGLKPNLDFIYRLCPTNKSDRVCITVPFADSLANIIWRLVIQANVFTTAAAQQLQFDIEALWLGLSLPEVNSYKRLMDSTFVLQSGLIDGATVLSKDDIDGLMSRRTSK